MMTEPALPSDPSSSRTGQTERGTVRRRGLIAVLLRPKVAIPLGLPAALVLGPFLCRWYRLAGVPDSGDPFGQAGDTLRYRRDQEGALIWSVGMNGVDDGGVFNSELNKDDLGYRILRVQPALPAASKSTQPTKAP